MAQLTGVEDNVSSAIVDINTIALTDWIVFASAATITKSGGGSTIVAPITGFNFGGIGNRTIGWTHGTPTSSGSDNNAKFDGSNTQTIQLPADTLIRVATFYFGTFNGAQFQFNASLSDSSAAPFTFTTSGGDKPWNITLTYQAASAGQALNVTAIPTASWAYYAAIGYSTLAPVGSPALFFGGGV